MAADVREGEGEVAVKDYGAVPSPLDGPKRTCRNCDHLADGDMCTYCGIGNARYTPGDRRHIPDAATVHCGQWRARRDLTGK